MRSVGPYRAGRVELPAMPLRGYSGRYSVAIGIVAMGVGDGSALGHIGEQIMSRSCLNDDSGDIGLTSCAPAGVPLNHVASAANLVKPLRCGQHVGLRLVVSQSLPPLLYTRRA